MAQPTQTQLLFDLIKHCRIELFHTPDRQCFATIKVKGAQETWPIPSSSLTGYLVHRFFEQYQKVPNEHVMQTALKMLQAQALFKGAEIPVFTRRAVTGSAMFLDLGTPEGHVVKIQPGKWEIITQGTPRFFRPPALRPLPLPQRGGSIDLLRTYLNIRDDTEWCCLSGWLIANYSAGPYPILNLRGPQSSAKSTALEILLSITDPQKGMLRSIPSDERDLAIMANQAWVLGFDNVSHLSTKMADAFCRMSTGGGLATRRLYSNDEQVIFEILRPVIITSINLVSTRSDFLDRTLLVTLSAISNSNRKPKATLLEHFQRDRPLILGAILERRMFRHAKYFDYSAQTISPHGRRSKVC